MLYNPDSDPAACSRYLRKHFGAAAGEAGEALAQASRILPAVTTAHGASAANNAYWVEMYTNQPVVDPKRRHPYTDSPPPRVFGNVSPFDPQLFSRINDFADELLKGERSGKYSPVEAAQWIEDFADAAARHLAQAEARAPDKSRPEWRRLAIDVAAQIDLGRFYGAKLRSGVLYRIFERTGDRTSLEEALRLYQIARAAWAALAEQTRSVYQADITVGEEAHLRGHWLDRLPAIDDDIADMAARLAQAKGDETRADAAAPAVREAIGRPRRPEIPCTHQPPARVRPGQPLELRLLAFKPEGVTALVRYRYVNQADRYATIPMDRKGNWFQASIPGARTHLPYPIQYYFELRSGTDQPVLHPGFGANPFGGQPYFVVRR
jgi:hypothetical protein